MAKRKSTKRQTTIYKTYIKNSKQVFEAVNEQFYSFHLSPSEAFRCFLVYTVFMHYDDIPISSWIRTQNNLMLNIDWQFSSLQTLFYLKRTCLFTCRKSKIKRPLPELIDTYKIPFINEPENIILKNNKSALVKKKKKPVDIKFSAHDACRE
jgi:hypothetical protein